MGAIRYGYYEKPTTNPKVFARQGAHGWRNKIATLAMEGVRRMRNMDPQSPMEERLDVMRGYAIKLKDSGYSTPERREVLKSGLIKFYRATEQAVAKGSISANRSRNELAGKRTMKAYQNKTWFAKRRGGKSVRQMKDDPWGIHRVHERGKGKKNKNKNNRPTGSPLAKKDKKKKKK